MLQYEDGYMYQVIRPMEPPKKCYDDTRVTVGWQISDLALEYMDMSINSAENQRKIGTLISRICVKRGTVRLAVR